MESYTTPSIDERSLCQVTSIAWYLDNKGLMDLEGEEMELSVTQVINNKSNKVRTSAANITLHIKCE